MTQSEGNVYRWLDAEELKPQRPADPLMKSFDKKLSYKLLDMLDQIDIE